MKNFIFSVIFLIFCSILPIQSDRCEAKIGISQQIKTNDYTLEYGTYKGYETDYDHETQTMISKKIFAVLTKKEIIINGIPAKYKIKDNKMYVNNRLMYEIIGNNKLIMLAGGGIIFEHE